MKNIVVITTGGTISTKRGPQWSGAVPLLKGDDFHHLLAYLLAQQAKKE